MNGAALRGKCGAGGEEAKQATRKRRLVSTGHGKKMWSLQGPLSLLGTLGLKAVGRACTP